MTIWFIFSRAQHFWGPIRSTHRMDSEIFAQKSWESQGDDRFYTTYARFLSGTSKIHQDVISTSYSQLAISPSRVCSRYNSGKLTLAMEFIQHLYIYFLLGMVDFPWLPWFGLDSGWAALCACTTKGPGVETHGSGRVLVGFSPNKRVVLKKTQTLYIYKPN